MKIPENTSRFFFPGIYVLLKISKKYIGIQITWNFLPFPLNQNYFWFKLRKFFYDLFFGLAGEQNL